MNRLKLRALDTLLPIDYPPTHHQMATPNIDSVELHIQEHT